MSEGVRNKLYNYEVPPPPKAWDKISAALDESFLSHEFPSVLYNLEASPPANSWEKIRASLDETAVPSLSRQRKITPFLRYAAAAAVMALIAFGSMRLLRNSGSKTEFAEKNIPAQNNTTPPAGANSATTKTNPIETEDARNDAALEASKQTIASLGMPAKRMKNFPSNFFSQAVQISEPVEDLDPTDTYRELKYAGATDIVTYPQSTDNLSARYVMLMTPDGNIIRMSKKLGDLVCCVSGEEQDKDCIDQMKRWREKIAKSSEAHSPGNFMDILSLVNSLQK